MFCFILNRDFCEPKKKIGFLKTHKCASSSIQNILLRYAVRNNVNVVLPQHSNYLGPDNPDYSSRFNRKMLEKTIWEQAGLAYDFFLCHTKWDHQEISQVLDDHGDVFYFSILRDPVDLFRSFWDYYNLEDDFQTSLDEYANTVIASELRFKNKTRRSRGYNQMLTDFGMAFDEIIPRGSGNNETVGIENVKYKIKEIDQYFDLIILADSKYFEDSIILLRNALCWEYEEVVNLKLNSIDLEIQSTISTEAQRNIKGKIMYLNGQLKSNRMKNS